MRVKSFERGRLLEITTDPETTSDDLAQAALDMIDRRDTLASSREHRLALAQVFATLAVHRAMREEHAQPGARGAPPWPVQRQAGSGT